MKQQIRTKKLVQQIAAQNYVNQHQKVQQEDQNYTPKSLIGQQIINKTKNEDQTTKKNKKFQNKLQDKLQRTAKIISAKTEFCDDIESSEHFNDKQQTSSKSTKKMQEQILLQQDDFQINEKQEQKQISQKTQYANNNSQIKMEQTDNGIKQFKIKRLNFKFDYSGEEEEEDDQNENQQQNNELEEENEIKKNKKYATLIFFKKQKGNKLVIQQTYTDDKYPPPFKQEFYKQADKRMLVTCRTKFRGKSLGQINSIYLGPENRLNDLLDKDTLNKCSQGQQQYHTNENKNQIYEYEKNVLPPSVVKKKISCNCKKTKCLKLYCDCFNQGEFCRDCNCTNCYNVQEHISERDKTMKQISEKNLKAFTPKVQVNEEAEESDNFISNRGCNCKKSNCLKKYCECYNTGVKCSENCQCNGCKNLDPIQIKKKQLEEEERLKRQFCKSENTNSMFNALANTNNQQINYTCNEQLEEIIPFQDYKQEQQNNIQQQANKQFPQTIQLDQLNSFQLNNKKFNPPNRFFNSSQQSQELKFPTFSLNNSQKELQQQQDSQQHFQQQFNYPNNSSYNIQHNQNDENSKNENSQKLFQRNSFNAFQLYSGQFSNQKLQHLKTKIEDENNIDIE